MTLELVRPLNISQAVVYYLAECERAMAEHVRDCEAAEAKLDEDGEEV